MFVLRSSCGFLGKECDIRANPQNNTISRIHCKVYAIAASRHDDPNDKGQLWVQDDSTFGTIVEAPSGHQVAALKKDKGHKLDAGSSIVLGQVSSSPWRMQIRWEPLVFCASRMDGKSKAAMKGSMTRLGAHLVSTIEGCTHVLMPKLIATKKVLLGAAKGLPIVSPQYIEEAVRQVSESFFLPDAHEFQPPAEDEGLKEKLDIDPQSRRDLLTGLTFYCFLKTQYEDLHKIIEAYGGNILLIKSSTRQSWMKQGRFVVLSPFASGRFRFVHLSECPCVVLLVVDLLLVDP